MNEYDIKVSSMLKDLEVYLQDRIKEPVHYRNFDTVVISAINMFMKENGYPMYCSDDYDLNICPEAYNMPEYCCTLLPLDVRYKFNKKDQTKMFVSLLKSGPSYNRRLSDLLARRKEHLSYRAEKIIYETQMAGYSGIDDLVKAYEEAQKTVEKTKWIKFRYALLSHQEILALQNNQDK